MNRRHLAILFSAIGILVFISIFLLGNQIKDPIKINGLHKFISEQGPKGGISFVMFAFAFPLGILAFVFAGLVTSHARIADYIKAFVTVHVLASLMTVWPMIVGRQQSPLYFGTGGVVLILLITGVCWYWARQRMLAGNERKRNIDLKGLAYFCFAMATWNSCGAAGMPAYAIYPEAVMANKMGMFVTQQFKVVMIYFILAWLFTFIYERRKVAT